MEEVTVPSDEISRILLGNKPIETKITVSAIFRIINANNCTFKCHQIFSLKTGIEILDEMIFSHRKRKVQRKHNRLYFARRDLR